MSDAPTRTRLRKEDRRDQLLDAAEKILLEQGTAGVTMERLAEFAGVSKALPYSHFENADAVLLAVYGRVVGDLGSRLVDALEGAPTEPRRDRTTLLVDTYLDTVAEIGPVLGVVTAPGSRTAELADGDQRLGVRFLTDLLVDQFAVAPARASLAAPIMLATATGSVAAWQAGDGTRAEIAALMVDLFETAMG